MVLCAIGPLYVQSRLSCLFVVLVYCGQTVGWTKMKLGTEVGLGSGHIVLDGDAAPPPLEKRRHAAQFSAHVYCGQTVAHLIYCWALVSNAGFAFCGCDRTFYGPPEHTSRGASWASLGRGLVGHCTCGHPLNPPMDTCLSFSWSETVFTSSL